MSKIKNGRPQSLGNLFFDDSDGYRRMRWCAGYCPKCGEKIGMTKEDIEEFSMNAPGIFGMFVSKVLHTKIEMPK